MRYSQNNEEDIILEHFKDRVGRFLDIGAYDGKTFSNTLKLAELGWRGVCVEGSPVNFTKLLEQHGKNGGIELMLAAVAACGNRVATWYDSGGDGISTTSQEHRKKWENGSSPVSFSWFSLYTMPVFAIFDRYSYNFDFVNLDVEGTNLDVFMELPWEKLTQVSLVCVEHDGHQETMETVLKPFGFSRKLFNGENVILAR